MAFNVLDTVDAVDNVGLTVGCLNVPKGVDLYYPKSQGDCSIIVLPFTTSKSKYVKPGSPFWLSDYWVYRGLGKDQKGSALDYFKTFKEPCAVTDSLAHYDGDPKKKPKSQRKAMLNCLVQIDGEWKQCVMDFSYANFVEKLIADVKAKVEREKWKFIQYFCDVDEGCIITFKWSEESLNGHKFYVAGSFDYDKHEGLDGKVAAAAAKVVDLDTLYNKMTYKEVAALYLGESVPDATPEPEDTPFDVGVANEPVHVATTEPTEAKQETKPAAKETKADKPKEDKPKAKKPAHGWKKDDTGWYGDKYVTVVKVVDDSLTVLDSEGDPHKIKASDLKTEKPVKEVVDTVSDDAPVDEPSGDDADWDKDWD